MLMLPDVVVLDLSHDELSPSRTSGILGRWITASILLGCLPLPLQSRFLPCNPNGNLLPVVLHEHTLAITVAGHTIKSANPRTTIDWTLAIGILPLALGAAIPRLMTTAIVGVAVAAVQCRCGRELAVATVRRRLGAQLTVLCIHIGMQLNSHHCSVLAAGAPICILLPLIARELVLEKGARQPADV
jgi:hypothetical protein